METEIAYNIVDMVAVVLLVVGLLQGLRRGLSGELAGVLSTAIAVGTGCYFYQPLGVQTYMHTRLDEQAAYALAFFLTMAGAFLLMVLVRILLRHLMEFTFKGKIERIGGALAGCLRAAVITAAIIFMFSLWPHDYLQRLFREESLAGRNLCKYIPPVYEELANKHPALPHLPKKPSDKDIDMTADEEQELGE